MTDNNSSKKRPHSGSDDQETEPPPSKAHSRHGSTTSTNEWYLVTLKTGRNSGMIYVAIAKEGVLETP